MAARDSLVALRYAVPRWSPAWAVPEVPVPESEVHDQSIEYSRALLLAWAERLGRDVKVLRNIGIRWVRQEPRAGFDPDLCLLDPAPDEPEGLSSLRLWEPNIAVPRLAIEIVSPGHPYKDYVDTPERAAACGIPELWVFDPLLAGPKKHGGPFLLQVWRDTPTGYERIAATSAPAYSPELNAWLHPMASRRPSQARLQLSDTEAGTTFWPTLEEQRRGAEARQRALAEQRSIDAEQRSIDAEQRSIDAEQRSIDAEQRAVEAERELEALRARLSKLEGQ